MPLLRRFNDQGIAAFRAYLATLRADKTLPAPVDLLTDDSLTQIIEPQTDCPEATFPNRLAVAEYLDNLLTPVNLANAYKDTGLWAWLALRFFEQLCPVLPNGTRDPGTDDRWIPLIQDSRRYYRQFMLGPSIIYQAHRDSTASIVGLLADRPHIATGEVFRSFIENPSLIRSKPAVEVATALYYDVATGKTKRGAGGGGRVMRLGTCRRLISVLKQYDCTFDLYFLTTSTLLNMLPPEFGSFRRNSSWLNSPSLK
jgi:hypothetical protein